MEKAKQVVGSSSSSSFTNELFGPKDSQTQLTLLLFLGLRRDPIHSGDRNSSRIQDPGNQYGNNTKYGTSDNGSKTSQNEKVEAPCNLRSSIYYGGQDVYPQTNQTTGSHNNTDHYTTERRDVERSM
ncbi:putative UDP-glycosyltransferase 85A1-like [Capsicum annuum]|nr:putative UDP-glycosyltransferase 85A1-like [Capsicum annuum]